MTLQLRFAFCFYPNLLLYVWIFKVFPHSEFGLPCPLRHSHRRDLLNQLRLEHVMGEKMKLGLNKVTVYLCQLKEVQGYLVQGY